MVINFIGPFKKFAYSNNYICNLVDYFSKYMYSHPISEVCINNIIILFYHHLLVNSKSYVVYINACLHFTNQKLYKSF